MARRRLHVFSGLVTKTGGVNSITGTAQDMSKYTSSCKAPINPRHGFTEVYFDFPFWHASNGLKDSLSFKRYILLPNCSLNLVIIVDFNNKKVRTFFLNLFN